MKRNISLWKNNAWSGDYELKNECLEGTADVPQDVDDWLCDLGVDISGMDDQAEKLETYEDDNGDTWELIISAMRLTREERDAAEWVLFNLGHNNLDDGERERAFRALVGRNPDYDDGEDTTTQWSMLWTEAVDIFLPEFESDAKSATSLADLHRVMCWALDRGLDQEIEDYSLFPTWGPKTEIVSKLMSEGDLVSWDTRDVDPANHRYLMIREENGETKYPIVTGDPWPL